MKTAAARTLPLHDSARSWEAGNQGVNEWESARESHETPSLLFFAKMEERQKRELSENLTRKFREFFPYKYLQNPEFQISRNLAPWDSMIRNLN